MARESLTLLLRNLPLARGVPPELAGSMATAAGLAGVLILAWAVNLVVKRVLLRGIAAVVRRTNFECDDALLESGVFSRISHLAPALVVHLFRPGESKGHDSIFNSSGLQAARVN